MKIHKVYGWKIVEWSLKISKIYEYLSILLNIEKVS